MRYLGSKAKLLNEIEKVFEQYNIDGNTFADLFSGTGVVGDFFKDRFDVISNDFLYYAHIISKAKLLFSDIPDFLSFRVRYENNIFNWLNNQTYVPDDSYFVYFNYTPIGGRFFFTEQNGIRIDGIRQQIEYFKDNQIINEDEYVFLLASLLESVTRFSNTSGTYEAFFKFWDQRALNEFRIEPLTLNIVKNNKNHSFYMEDANMLSRRISGDIAYIDPPYTVTQYISAYHLLETIARYDYPEIKGVGGKRSRDGMNSLYARRNQAYYQFEDLLRQLNFKHIIISYSNQGLITLDELVSLSKKFAVNNIVHIEYIDYQEYQNHRSSKKRNGKNLLEAIIYFEKDLRVIKSPLNYSGSKDTLVSQIIKELPFHITNFVDVMGGAFNVGANIVTTDSVYYNEIDRHVYSLINWLLAENKEIIVDEIEDCLRRYMISKKNKTAYLSLREHYNNDPNNSELFVLHLFSFQNMIRFNSKGEFNTPIGVAGYSDEMRDRILGFVPKNQHIILMNEDYININWQGFDIDSVFYFDPPYFITSAAYNDGKRGGKGWSINEEIELLHTLEVINNLGYKFILSNVIEHKGKKHELLINWIEHNNFTIKEIGTSGWRYEKNEIIVKNY